MKTNAALSLVVYFAIIAGLGSWGLTTRYYHDKINTIVHGQEVEVESLESTIGFLDEDLDEGARLMGLAVEFNTTPTIVQIVDYYSRIYVTRDSEWALIQSHQNFTHLMLSLMWHESRVTATATGDKGRARGLTQIWTTTAQDYEPEITAKELLNPETNIKISMQHFAALLKHFEGNEKLTLLAWNRGRTRVDDLISMGHDPANGFAEKVRVASVNASRHAVVASFMKGE